MNWRTVMFDLRSFDVQQRLNSLTKYPSIPTFHEMDLNTGMLDGSKPVDFGGQLVSVTEKIDGTNARIIVFSGKQTLHDVPTWIIGSRENLLTADMDWIRNPELGIVAELAKTADDLCYAVDRDAPVRVYFFEVYGGRIGGAWKNYNKSGEAFGHRLFDVIEFPDDMFAEVMSRPREHISSWRQHGGQPFVGWDRMLEIAQETNLQRVPTIEHRIDPRGIAFDGLQHTLTTLESWFPGGSEAVLESGAQNRPEGVVFKSLNNPRVTAKLRFQDYRGTIRRLEAAKLKEAARAMRDVE
jgi:hypothetical protein